MKANLTAIILLIIVLGLWIISGIVIYHEIPNWDDRSSFGSMYGAIGALFSGLALIGVVYAILLQQQELKLQREEMEANREELRRSAEAQEKSEITLGKQNTAYNLTVKLSALSSMLFYHNNQSTSASSGIKQKDSSESAEKIINEMEIILDEIRQIPNL